MIQSEIKTEQDKCGCDYDLVIFCESCWANGAHALWQRQAFAILARHLAPQIVPAEVLKTHRTTRRGEHIFVVDGHEYSVDLATQAAAEVTLEAEKYFDGHQMEIIAETEGIEPSTQLTAHEADDAIERYETAGHGFSWDGICALCGRHV